MKLKVDSKNQFLGRMAIKHKVSMVGYPISVYKEGKDFFVINSGMMFGDEKNKKELIKDIKKQPEFVKLELKNDFTIIVSKQPLFTEAFFDPRIIRPSPVIINYKEEKHIWHLASFDKILLTKVYNFAKKYLNAEIIKFQKEKLSNIAIINILPNLSKKQKQALEIAINNGYYNYPKKVGMKYLAKIMGVAYSTYQEHLKKAENKLLPSMYKNI